MQEKIGDKFADECTENVKEVKLGKITSAEEGKISINAVLVHSTLCYFQYFLQLTLELVLILLILVGTKKRILLMLSLVPILKQQFNELINEKSQTNRDKNRTYYFYNDIIVESNSSLLKIDKKLCTDIDNYYIGYITIKKIDDCKNMYCVNSLYLIISKVDGHIECKKNWSKYLVFDSRDENKEVVKKYTELWDGIKMKLKQ